MFVRLPFSAFDFGLASVVPPRLLMAYLALRTMVWRSEKKGLPELRQLVRNGDLVAHISQRKLATMVGLKRRQAAGELLAKMADLGWVQFVSLGTGRTNLYVVGRCVTDGGREYESYFISEQIEEFVDGIPEDDQKRLSAMEWSHLASAYLSSRSGDRLGAQGDVVGEPNRFSRNVHGGANTKKREGQKREISKEDSRNGKPSLTVKSAIEAFNKTKDRERKDWSFQALVGWFFVCHKKFHGRSVSKRGPVVALLAHAIRRLTRTEGRENVARAIETVFRIAWIKSNHHLFLVDEGKYESHVMPHIVEPDNLALEARLRPPGEPRLAIATFKSRLGSGR